LGGAQANTFSWSKLPGPLLLLLLLHLQLLLPLYLALLVLLLLLLLLLCFAGSRCPGSHHGGPQAPRHQPQQQQ
jgi:hypothetical protein